MMVVNEDHYVKLVAYDAGEYTLTAAKMGTRYAEAVFHRFVNAHDPEDIKAANVLQDFIEARLKSLGVFEVPKWDRESLDTCRAAILGLNPFAPASTRTFGDVDPVDPVRHLIGTARTWGVLELVYMFIDHTAWGWKLFIGVVSIIAGGSILMYPVAAAIALPQVFLLVLGIWALVEGIILLTLAFKGGGWGAGVLGVTAILLEK
jgi:hypothetical protein